MARLLGFPVWLRSPGPLESQKVCLLACHAGGGVVSDHSLRLAVDWSRQGFKVVLVVASDTSGVVINHTEWPSAIDGILLRYNDGYDFGSWAAALRSRADVRNCRLLVMTNDSLYGPFAGFAALLERVDASSGDVVAMTDSHEERHHIQSYLVCYRPAALKSRAFAKFWAARGAGGRRQVIQQAEIPLMRVLEQAGLRIDVLFPTATQEPVNPTLVNWRNLVAQGFPFVKVQLLRENPWNADINDWDRVLASQGFDPQRVQEHLGDCFSASAAFAAASTEFRSTATTWTALQPRLARPVN